MGGRAEQQVTENGNQHGGGSGGPDDSQIPSGTADPNSLEIHLETIVVKLCPLQRGGDF